MNLSNKNLGNLNTFIKKHNLLKNNNKKSKNSQPSHNSSKLNDPSKIFYSIIDNSENINQTSEPNQSLKKCEEDFRNINSKDAKVSNNLSIEDQLYDEFNYLLDE